MVMKRNPWEGVLRSIFMSKRISSMIQALKGRCLVSNGLFLHDDRLSRREKDLLRKSEKKQSKLQSLPINERAWSLRPVDDQCTLGPVQILTQLPFQSRLQSFWFSFWMNDKRRNKKQQADRRHQDSLPTGQIDKESTGQRHGEYSFRKIGKILRGEFSSSLIDRAHSHVSISSPRETVKIGANVPAPILLEGNAAILFIHRLIFAIRRHAGTPARRHADTPTRSLATRFIAVALCASLILTAPGMTVRVLASLSRSFVERNELGVVAEGDVEVREKILATQEIKTDLQLRREADGCGDNVRANLHEQVMNINGNQSSIANGHGHLLSLAVIDAQAGRFVQRENRNEGSRIDVRFGINPSERALKTDRKNGTRDASIALVGKGYSAHTKSCGRGTGNPVGMTCGCLDRAKAKSLPALRPTNNSPAATTAYWPAYLSTSFSKCRRIHSSSLTRRESLRACCFREVFIS